MDLSPERYPLDVKPAYIDSIAFVPRDDERSVAAGGDLACGTGRQWPLRDAELRSERCSRRTETTRLDGIAAAFGLAPDIDGRSVRRYRHLWVAGITPGIDGEGTRHRLAGGIKEATHDAGPVTIIVPLIG